MTTKTETKEERIFRFQDVLAQLERDGRHLTVSGICEEFDFNDSWAYTDAEVKQSYRDYADVMKMCKKHSITAIQEKVLSANNAPEVEKLQAENQALKARIEALENQRQPLTAAIDQRLQVWRQRSDGLRQQLDHADRMIALLSELKECEE